MNQQHIIELLSEHYPSLRVVHHNGIQHLTSRGLFDKGIKSCDACGNLMPVEEKFCKCGEEPVVILTEKLKRYEPNLVVAQVIYNTVVEGKVCKRCKQLKPLKEFIVRYNRVNNNMHNSSCHRCIDLLRAKKQKQ